MSKLLYKKYMKSQFNNLYEVKRGKKKVNKIIQKSTKYSKYGYKGSCTH